MNIFRNKKYINWFSIILFTQIMCGLGFFLYGYFYPSQSNLQKAENTPPSIGIDVLSEYLKLIIGNGQAMARKISLHNFILATEAYILNIFSFGLSSLIFLAQSCFLFAVNLKQNSSLPSLSFVLLEMLGVFLACTSGTYISYMRYKKRLSVKNVIIFSLIIIASLSLIYLAAAFIESKVIKGALGWE